MDCRLMRMLRATSIVGRVSSLPRYYLTPLLASVKDNVYGNPAANPVARAVVNTGYSPFSRTMIDNMDVMYLLSNSSKQR